MEGNSTLITSWLSFTTIQTKVTNQLESMLQEKHQLSLKEYYVMFYLSEAPEKKLRFQDLQNKVGLSQSAMSRLVSRFEARDCGVLKRHACEEDKRAFYTSLTEEGERKLKKATLTLDSALSDFFADREIQQGLKTFIGKFDS